MNKTKKIEKVIGYSFKDQKLLIKSLTHKSANPLDNNEKLEFLGDRVLGLILSNKIFELYPNESEGDLDKRFASLVNRKTCLKISKNLKMENYIILSKAYLNKNKIEDKILADSCEALIGALFLDGGFDIVKKFVLFNWISEIKKTYKTEIDSKTQLQEHSLKFFKKLPDYKVLKSSGPRHLPSYKVSVKITNSNQIIGNGKSIKLAQQNAAKNLLQKIGL
jgi:ribonuclease-3|tara:strand:- start:2189 stop:2851 length:663 start_codon:yes stop_codon:yes gene_type:complete